MPEQALQRLLEGNRRYIANRLSFDVSDHRRVELAAAQEPFAMILGCVDSRVPPELIFDQGLGDLFVIRTAGQVLDRAVLGSLEFGVGELHIRVLVVLGHEHCGAIKAAIDLLKQHDVAEAEVEFLVEALAPAVAQATAMGGDVWENAVHAQIAFGVERLKQAPVMKQAIADGRLKIVGAWYSLETGQVAITVS